jgi:polyphosphate kinase
MDRNLSRRVEVVFPIEQPNLKQRLIREVLEISLADNTKARELQADGTWRRITAAPGQLRVRSQEKFLELAAQNNVVGRLVEDQVSPLPYVKPRPPRERRVKQRTG